MKRVGFAVFFGLAIVLSSAFGYYIIVQIANGAALAGFSGWAGRDLFGVVGIVSWWLALFVPSTVLWRRRLWAREGPLWWTLLPGGLALFSVLVICIPALIGVVYGLRIFLMIEPYLAREALIFLVLGPLTVSIGTMVWLTVECLRPDRRADSTDIFD